MRPTLAVFAVVSMSCSQPIVALPDAGSAGGNTAGGATAGGATAGGATAGGSTAGGASDSGTGDSGLPDAGRYLIVTLDSTTVGSGYLDMAVDRTQSRVGVAYFSDLPDGGAEVRYVEWQNGTVGAVSVVAAVTRSVGITVDLNPVTGEPGIGYLGGGSDTNAFWTNSDAELATRSGSAWSKTIVASRGDQITCGNPVSDTGVVVGLWPALRYDAAGGLHYCYRDVHNGQFPQQDWAGSDVECWSGMPGALIGSCTKAGGNDKDAPGGRIAMTMAGSGPIITYDHVFGGADTAGQDVFIHRHDAGAWSTTPRAVASVTGTQTGASLAWDPVEGTGVAVLDTADNVLRYYQQAPGAAAFSAADPVFGMGTGGWYPSLAMDPALHEPAIAFYVCAPNTFVTVCPAGFDELRIAQRSTATGAWQEHVVDTEGGRRLRLGFLPNGKRVVAYRLIANGHVALAVER